MNSKNKPNEINLVRIYDAPVKAVWDAWTDPTQAAKWWGPRGFTITTHTKDFRPGGSWRYTMHGPDGVDYPNVTKYFEVEKYSRLVYDHGGTDDAPPLFQVTVTFEETNGKTKMDMTMAFTTPEAAEATKKVIKKAGGDSTWDRLSEYLTKEDSGKEKFVINRSFDAPIAKMFTLWTDPHHLAKWLAPAGAHMEFKKADIRSGGSSFYFMSFGEMKMYGRIQYLEITPPDRLVYNQQFCDESGNVVTRHPMSPTWPETMHTTVTFAEEASNQTRVTVEWEIYGNTSAVELETFAKARGNMSQGWTGSFDQLETYLSKT